jgi:TRAP transporter TAXI family solute receptor
VTVLKTQGSVDNLKAVAEGRADVGFATVDATSLAAQGEEPFVGALPVLTLTRSTEALASREIAGFFVTGGLPMPALVDLSKRSPFRLLTLREELEGLQGQFGEIYQPRTIAATRTYVIPDGVEQLDQVDTLAVTNVLVVRRSLPEATAHRLTELLFAAKPRLVAAHEEARRLDHRSALATYPVQLHPGAADYYRDHKVMAQSR